MKKIIGLILFFVAVGMLLMLVIHNRFIGLIMIALLLFAGYYLFLWLRVRGCSMIDWGRGH